MENHQADTDGDGTISAEEVKVTNQLLKAETQAYIAKICAYALVIVTLLLFLPWVPVERVTVLGDILALFYISLAGVIGAYMGVAGWMAVKNKTLQTGGK